MSKKDNIFLHIFYAIVINFMIIFTFIAILVGLNLLETLQTSYLLTAIINITVTIPIVFSMMILLKKLDQEKTSVLGLTLTKKEILFGLTILFINIAIAYVFITQLAAFRELELATNSFK